MSAKGHRQGGLDLDELKHAPIEYTPVGKTGTCFQFRFPLAYESIVYVLHEKILEYKDKVDKCVHTTSDKFITMEIQLTSTDIIPLSVIHAALKDTKHLYTRLLNSIRLQ